MLKLIIHIHLLSRQLFGDSVNTASRMESNGQPGRIHCSEETANALREAGKEQWLTPREDRIVAKGKGELQTFWINVGSSGTRASVISGSEENPEVKEIASLERSSGGAANGPEYDC